MKRNDGGYVLVYVVVVIVILCLLVPAACANSLQNLKAQQASIERTRQLYEAEGQIERFVAEMLQRKPKGTIGEDDEDAAKAAAQEAFAAALGEASNAIPVSFTPPEGNKWEQNTCKVSATAGSIGITAEIAANLTIHTERHSAVNGEGVEVFEYYAYEITACTISYTSYDISSTEGGGT